VSTVSRRWILTEVEESLKRLQTDWIDLYRVHRPDEPTDVEETLSVLSDLVREGKIRAFGCSTFPAADIVEAHVPRPDRHPAARRDARRNRAHVTTR
jgi:aryl-alcohol dehydrogenase-like predicted oxidoreductase